LNINAARLSPGAISESSSSHLPPIEGSKTAKPVMFPPGWLIAARKDDRDRPRFPLEGYGRLQPACEDDVGLQADQLLRERWCPIGVTGSPPKVDPHVAAIGPTQPRKRLRERENARLPQGIVFVARLEHADTPYPLALLRARRERPRRRAANTCDEIAPSHL
jgi:hypothetical protein